MSFASALRLAVIVFALANTVWALDPSRSATQYNRRTWRRGSGLPVTTVNTIGVAPDGRLWLGTSQGLINFDGVEFHSLSESGNERIADRVVTSVIPRAEGGIWYGLDNGGYGYFDGKKTHELKYPSWMKTEPVVRQLLETEDGFLWLASTAGVNRAAGAGELKPMTENTRADIFSLHQNADGSVWIGTAYGTIFVWKDNTLSEWKGPDLGNAIIEVIAHDKQGSLWIATPTAVYRHDAKIGTVQIPTETFSPKSLFIDSHNTVWIGTYGGGLFRYRDGHISRITHLEGLASDDVLCFAESPDGSLWIGTSDGLTQLSDLKFPMFSKYEGLAYDGALCVSADPRGGVWVGTPNGISYFDGSQAENYGINTTDGFGSNWVKRIYPAKNGDLYMIGGRKNLDWFSNGKVVRSQLCEQWPQDITEDDKGIIVALAGKLMRLVNGEFVPYLLKDGTAVDLNWINNLLMTEDKVLWIATDNGVFSIKDGVLFDYCKANSLPAIRYDYLAEDGLGNMWAAQHHGIARCRNGKMRIITREQGLYQNYVYAIVSDLRGNLWMDSGRGIFCVNEQEINDVADGKLSQVKCRVYEGSDAVKSTDKVSIEYSGARSIDGKIWFPTSKGVVMIDPANIPESLSTSKVSITSVRVNGKPYDPDESLSLEAGPGNVEFGYVAIEYIAPNKVQYRYRLEGWDREWNDAGNRRAAYYTNLPPGEYRFEVQATNTAGVWNSSIDSVSFVLPRRFFETLGFKIGCGLLLVGTGMYLAWVRNVHRRQRELVEANVVMEEKVRERTAALRDEIEVRRRAQEETERLHDQLRASADAAQAAAKAKSQFLANMSHEIRTPMNAIVGMSQLLRETPLSEHQLELVETTHNSAEALLTVLNDILDFSKIEAGKLNLEQLDFDLIDAIEESLDLLSVSASAKEVELASIIDHDLPSILRGDPSRLRQILLNLLGNAVKFTQRGSITLTARRESSASDGRVGVRFEIRDTGIGISAEAQAQLFKPFTQADNSTTRRFGGTGLGLAISQQIIHLMGGTLGVESTLGVGSTFWFAIPLLPASKSAAPQLAEAGSHPVAGLRLLVLQTSPLLQKVLENHAKAWRLRFVFCGNPTEAQQLAIAGKADGCPFHAVIYQKEPRRPDGKLLIPSVVVENFALPTILLTSLKESKETLILPAGVIAVVPSPLRTRRLYRALETAAGSSPMFEKQVFPATGTAPGEAPVSEKARHNLKILVAEDNVVNQRVVQLQLRKAGYDAKIVGNGVEVLKELEVNAYDIILMDCQMPEMDGYETTRRIRQQDRIKDLYIVAMTANSLDGDREKCLEAGMTAYLSKPTREKDLVAALEAAAAAKKPVGS